MLKKDDLRVIANNYKLTIEGEEERSVCEVSMHGGRSEQRK